jgi:tetratricopeptide (TPR) repeat protein
MPQENSAGNIFEELARKYGKPGDPDFHNNLGNAYQGQGKLDEAIAEFHEALRLKPSDEVYHCNLAVALALKGDHEEALREYREALRLEPHDYQSHYNMGNLLFKMGRADEAIAAYLKAIESDPERPEGHFNLAGSYWQQSRTAEAAVHYEKALAGGIGSREAAGAHLRLGAAYTEAKEWNKAEKHLLAALESMPDHFMTNYCLALVYLNIDWGKMNWTARAKALMFAEKARELDPDDDDARQLAMAALAGCEKEKPPAG